MNYIDLFAGAGGLSEGFKRAGFNPIAHVEMNSHACNTIKTRMAYYDLKDNNKENNDNQDNKDTNNNDLDKELERQNPLLWFIDKIIKLLVKIFKRRKK